MPARIHEQLKVCVSCGQPFGRRIYSSELREAMVYFIKRKTCSRSCSLKGNTRLKGKRWSVPWKRNLNRSADIKFRESAEARQWSKNVLERDNFTCQIYGQRGGKLHADHIKPFVTFFKERLNLQNGRTLCISCHRKTDTYGWNAYWINIKTQSQKYGRI